MCYFFFSAPPASEIYTLSLHDALPIYGSGLVRLTNSPGYDAEPALSRDGSKIAFVSLDRKSTRLNSSHSQISYAVFRLKKKMTRFPPELSGLRVGAAHRQRSLQAIG